jgi:hypothetical protein
MGNIPNYEHDDALYLNNREQKSYNCEKLSRIDSKYTLPSRFMMMNPNFHKRERRYSSHMMARYPGDFPYELFQ